MFTFVSLYDICASLYFCVVIVQKSSATRELMLVQQNKFYWISNRSRVADLVWARLSYRYCTKNVSGHRRHPRSVVAYSAEVAHRAVFPSSALLPFCGTLIILQSVTISYQVLEHLPLTSATL